MQRERLSVVQWRAVQEHAAKKSATFAANRLGEVDTSNVLDEDVEPVTLLRLDVDATLP